MQKVKTSMMIDYDDTDDELRDDGYDYNDDHIDDNDVVVVVAAAAVVNNAN